MTKLVRDEAAVKQGAANLQRGMETVGGELILTDQNMVFTPHRINFHRDEIVFPVADIRRTSLAWTKFLNMFPIAPNSLEVHMENGASYRFVLSKRDEWKKVIDEAIDA